MELTHSEQKQILEEDLQIVRATLEMISADIRLVSDRAANEIAGAVEKLEYAQREFARASEAMAMA